MIAIMMLKVAQKMNKTIRKDVTWLYNSNKECSNKCNRIDNSQDKSHLK